MDRPLQGARVLVTRPRERADELCRLLEGEGAEVFFVPLLELAPPEDPRPLRSAAQDIQRFQWIVFASPSAVEALLETVQEVGTMAGLQRTRIAAIGPATAETARRHGLLVERQAHASTAIGLFDALRDSIATDDEVLLPAAQEGRRELEDALKGAGVRVTRVAAYRSTKKSLDPAILWSLKALPPSVVLFASPRTAQAFLEAFGDEGRGLLSGAEVVARGPTPAGALQALGVRVSAVADQPTSASLVDAAARAVRR